MYVGLDLAWSPRNPSGVAALVEERRGLAVAACELAGDDDAIVAFVARHAAPEMVVMVDAPLRVPNLTGMRECDRETHRRFGRFQAGAYPANRRTMGRYLDGVIRGEALLGRLAALGVREAPLAEAGVGRSVYECYPHPAQVVLFGLDRVLKYKKKAQPWAEARRELARLLAAMTALERPRLLLPPALARTLAPGRAVGRAYKAREDRLDGLFCAYLAALAPRGRLEMLGSLAEGHIVVPRAP